MLWDYDDPWLVTLKMSGLSNYIFDINRLTLMHFIVFLQTGLVVP